MFEEKKITERKRIISFRNICRFELIILEQKIKITTLSKINNLEKISHIKKLQITKFFKTHNRTKGNIKTKTFKFGNKQMSKMKKLSMALFSFFLTEKHTNIYY